VSLLLTAKPVAIKLVVGPASAKREVKSTVSPEVLAKIYELLLQNETSKTATQPNFTK
jgi:hypothetical protein